VTTQIADILELQQKYHSYIDGVVGSSVSGLTGMLNGTKTWHQAMVGVYNSLATSFNQMLTRMVSNWIVQHVFMTATQRAQLAAQAAQHLAAEAAKTGATVVGGEARVASTAAASAQSAAIVGMHNMKEITSHAAVAAAAAYHAMAGIPIIGPGLGAIAAAVTFAAVEAYGALASFDVGTNSVPTDMVAQVHAGERIIPAADNRQLISTLSSISSGTRSASYPVGDRRADVGAPGFLSILKSLSPPSSSSVLSSSEARGDSIRNSTTNNSSPTFNYQPQHTNMHADFESLLRKDGSTMRKWLRNEIRNGSLKF
jgi:hypothetical protein